MNSYSSTGTRLKKAGRVLLVTSVTLAVLFLFLSPFAFMIFTSLKTQDQISIIGAPIWPAQPTVYEYDGKEVEVFNVPMNTCTGGDPNDTEIRELAIVKKGARISTYVDPANLERGEFECEGSWRSLDRPWMFSPTWANYTRVWNEIPNSRGFLGVLWNTTYYALTTVAGVLISTTLVAYGFSRFNFPGRDFLFIVLISTIFLPGFVTLIPTYTFFQRIGWVGTWKPLIVPAFFANAYNVFLLRQYFMTLPRELDEAAKVDGAGPLRVLWSVILPQSYPALMAITVFHIVFAWNDYFGPLVYLSSNRDAWPVSVALSLFNGIFGQQPQLIQAGSLMTLLMPVLLFLFAQRFFIQGIVITGVDK